MVLSQSVWDTSYRSIFYNHLCHFLSNRSFNGHVQTRRLHIFTSTLWDTLKQYLANTILVCLLFAISYCSIFLKAALGPKTKCYGQKFKREGKNNRKKKKEVQLGTLIR